MEYIIKSIGPKPSTLGPGIHVPQPNTAHEHWDDEPGPSQYGERRIRTPPNLDHCVMRVLSTLCDRPPLITTATIDA